MARFWRIECQNSLKNHSFKIIDISDLNKFAISRLTEKFLSEIHF